MPMRPEDIDELLAQFKSPGQANPLAAAIGKFSGQQPGMGGGMMPQSVGGTPRPNPLPPSPVPDMGPYPAPLPKMGADRNMMPVPPPEQYPGGPTGLPPGYQSPNDIPDDEAMLDQVQQGMGSEGEGDMQADSDALVQMYESGDPNDPATLEQWRAAKDDFVAKYGEENLPDLPNDPDSGAQDEYGGAEGSDQYAAEDSESRQQQSRGAYEDFRKRNRSKTLG